MTWTSEPTAGGWHWAKMTGMYNDRGDVAAYHVEIVKVFYFREVWHLQKAGSSHEFTKDECGFTGFYGPLKMPALWSESGTPTPGPLKISASGDPDFPFFVSPLDNDGISLPPVAAFKHHADALRFVECAKVQP